jgi:hypothetical protein
MLIKFIESSEEIHLFVLLEDVLLRILECFQCGLATSFGTYRQLQRESVRASGETLPVACDNICVWLHRFLCCWVDSWLDVKCP